MKLVDLSHIISNEMTTYPSDPDVEIRIEKDIINNRSLLHSFKMGTHTGTHLDAPAHVIPNGKTVDDFPLNNFTGIAIKVNSNCWQDINNIEYDFDGIIYDSGWYVNFNNPEVFYSTNRPNIPIELVEIAVEKKIKFFGTDLPSVDNSGSIEKPIHNALLKNEIIIYEALASLDQLPISKSFSFYGFPLFFKKLDGSPVRAVAKINSKET